MSRSSEGPASGYWSSLADAADTGHLFLAPEVAKECANACDEYLGRLRATMEAAQALPRITGYGEFISGKQLAEILSDKMSGSGNSLVTVLQSHIEVVMEMQTVFAKFFTATQQIDDDSSADISRNGPN